MALTTEQQAQVEFENALRAEDRTEDGKRNKLDAVRMAQEILVENRRTKTASEVTDITASEVTTLADSLITYINS